MTLLTYDIFFSVIITIPVVALFVQWRQWNSVSIAFKSLVFAVWFLFAHNVATHYYGDLRWFEATVRAVLAFAIFNVYILYRTFRSTKHFLSDEDVELLRGFTEFMRKGDMICSGENREILLAVIADYRKVGELREQMKGIE